MQWRGQFEGGRETEERIRSNCQNDLSQNWLRHRHLRQHFSRDNQQPLHGRANPPARAVAQRRNRRIATLEWVYWFDHRRLLEPIGNLSPAEVEDQHYAAADNIGMAA